MTPEQKSKMEVKIRDALYFRHERELARGFLRYEYIRCLNARKVMDLNARNLAGEGTFDDLVDLLIVEET